MQYLVTADHSSDRKRHISGFLFLLVWLVVFRETLGGLYHLARSDNGHSHILAIPFIAAYFIFTERKKTLGAEWTGPGLQAIFSRFLLAGGVIFFVLGIQFGTRLLPVDALSLSTASAVLLLIGLMLAFVPGIDISHSMFPVFLLLLLIPIPSVGREVLVAFLVEGSTAFTQILFKLTGTPFFREDTMFLLPGLSIEIADECSGIRSSIGLFITLLLASHLFLKKWWSKTALMATVIPMVLVKNAIRITTLTLLAVHVDSAFLTNSPLHRSGGVVFFAIALVLLLPVLVLLRKIEGRGSTKSYNEEIP